MQDYLNLGSFARMNTPWLATDNWQWRAKKCDFSDNLANDIAHLVKLYGRE